VCMCVCVCVCVLQEVDIEDWKANTRYEGDAMTSADSEQVKWFWSMVDGMSEEERRAVLQFATASPNVPVGGFAQLQSATGTLHPFTLSELTGRAATNTLPRAAACFNTLYLPVFKSEEQMKSQIKVRAAPCCSDNDEHNCLMPQYLTPTVVTFRWLLAWAKGTSMRTRWLLVEGWQRRIYQSRRE
jgi:hypothetical protein